MAAPRSSKPTDDPLVAALESALRTGALSGAAGFLFGGAAGILRGAPLFLFASVSGIQTFVLGTAFSGCRSGVLQAWKVDAQEPSTRDLTKASAIAGGLSGGATGFIFRGRRNVLPGFVMFALFGAVGQHFSNSWHSPTSVDTSRPGFWKRMSESSWSPVKLMSNEEYAQMLREQQLRIDVEIALIDDKISAIKAQADKSKSLPLHHPASNT